jgi:hypothetical protein
MRFRFILGIRNHAVLVVPFQEGGWGAVEIKRIQSIASHEEQGQLYLAHCFSLSLLLQQLGCGHGKNFNICVLTGKWCSRTNDGVQLRANSSSLQRYQMIDDSSDLSVVEAVSISDPFISLPRELSETPTESLKQRAKVAKRSKETIDAKAVLKHAKSGDVGGYRDSAGYKPKDVVANSIRRGHPKYDHLVLLFICLKCFWITFLYIHNSI